MKNYSVVWAILVVGLGVLGGVGARGWADQETHQRVEGGDGQTAPDIGAQPEGGAASAAPSTSVVTAPTAPGFISVDFKDADIRQVLRVISLKGGVDIVAGSDVEGLISVKLTNVPWEQALDIILRTYGFTYERKDNIVRVMTIASLEQEALSTEVFPLDYAKSKDVPDVVKEMLSERGKVKFDERTNTIIVTDIPSSLFRIKGVIARLDRRTPQTLIETKVVETKLNKNENLGINWGPSVTLTETFPTAIQNTFPFPAKSSLGTLGTLFGVSRAGERSGTAMSLGTLGMGTYATVLNFLQSRTDTYIVSNPSIAVLNNQEAKIHIGQEYPIPNYTIDPTSGKTQISGYTAKNIGTVLTVTPHVNPSNEIVVDLKPEVIAAETPVSFSTGTGTVELPLFSTQTAQTQVRIRNGETIAIGGLIKTSEAKTQSKIPILGDIPIIGLLFRNTQRNAPLSPSIKQDLLIFLTVKLMDEEKNDSNGQKVAVVPPMASSP